MEPDELRTVLRETGVAGVVLLAIGLVVVGRQNRRAGVGAAAVVVGIGLLGHGLVGSFLESMGMSYDDL